MKVLKKLKGIIEAIWLGLTCPIIKTIPNRCPKCNSINIVIYGWKHNVDNAWHCRDCEYNK